MRDDIAGAVQVLLQHVATSPAGGRGQGKLAAVGFSLGGAYALDLSVKEAEEIAAVVTFYCAYSGLEYSRARAAYLCHFAENDPFYPPEAFAEMAQEIQAAGRPITSYTYPGTTHCSSRRIARSMTPRLLTWLGSGPLNSCTSGLIKHSVTLDLALRCRAKSSKLSCTLGKSCQDLLLRRIWTTL